MVRIQRRVSKKQYLNSKHTYEYERMFLYIPRKYARAMPKLTIILTEDTEKRLRGYIAKKYPTEVYGKISQVIEEAVKGFLTEKASYIETHFRKGKVHSLKSQENTG